MKEELISIIVPIYNVEKYLDKCVRSILSQDYQNIEILLIDDGSTDSSGRIADEFDKNFKNIKVFHKKNGGLSDARNFGIKQSKGKYLGFIDSDDYVETNMFSFLYNNIKKYDADISICGRFINYEDGREIVQHTYEVLKVMTNEEGLIALNSFKYFDMSSCDKLYKKEIFSNIEFPYGLKCEDYYTMYKLFDKSKVIVYDSKPMYHYYQREGSISRNKIMDTAFIEASKSQIEYFKINHPNLLYVAYTSYVFANISHYNKFIKYNIKCDKKLEVNLKNEVKKNLRYVLKNPDISKVKKIQASVFSVSLSLYKILKRILSS